MNKQFFPKKTTHSSNSKEPKGGTPYENRCKGRKNVLNHQLANTRGNHLVLFDFNRNIDR